MKGQYTEGVLQDVRRQGFAIRHAAEADAWERDPAFHRFRVCYLAEYVMRMSDRPEKDPYTYVFDKDRHEWTFRDSPYRPGPLSKQPAWVTLFEFLYEPCDVDFFGKGASKRQWEVEGAHNEVSLFCWVDFFIYLREAPEDMCSLMM